MRKRLALGLAIAAAALVAVLGTEARAQNLFDFLFGGFQRQAPQQQQQAPPPGGSIPEAGYGGGQAFCVRLCDGRYFPLQPHPTASPSQLCSAFCPATQTRIFRGNEIQTAVGQDGSRYQELKNAYLYRKQLVSGCTCNGKDSLGLVTLDASNDPTLQPGDTVATPDGKTATVKVAPPGGAPPPGAAPPTTGARPPAPVQQRQY
ncbi:MAG TPA: DUF2865 domain-containing protein [Xanthobacteraceae bacterium]|jgi:hypothetical protein